MRGVVWRLSPDASGGTKEMMQPCQIYRHVISLAAEDASCVDNSGCSHPVFPRRWSAPLDGKTLAALRETLGAFRP